MNRFLVLMAAFLVALTLWVSAGTEEPPEATAAEFVRNESAITDNRFTDGTITPVPLVHITQPTTTETKFSESRYASISLSADDMELLARIIWLEARGESADGQQAVAEVVFNRMLSGLFPDTLQDVIYQDGQFSTASSADKAKPGEEQYAAIQAALTGPYILPTEVVFFATFPENDNVWGTIGGHTFCYPYYWEGE